MKFIVILLYFAVLLLIGALASRRVKTLSDFYVGGKNLGYWVVAFSSRASGESAWLYLGLTGLGAMLGLQAMWVVVGETLGVAIAWFFMARPFKRATDACGAMTVPDYLVSRFADWPRTARFLRYLSAAVLTIFVTIYVSAQIDATGIAFEAFLKSGYFRGALIGFGIVVIYTLSGGFVAVAWSDLFQGLVMLAGLLLLPIAALIVLRSGTNPTPLSAIFFGDLLPHTGDGWLSTATMIGYLAIGLGFLGSPQVFVRFMSIRDEQEILSGRWVAIVFTILTDGGAVLAGMCGRVLVEQIQPGVELFGEGNVLGKSGQLVLPVMVEQLFPAMIVGGYVAAVLAASMSTIDSLLVVASSAVTHDMIESSTTRKPTAGQLNWLSRGVTLALALVALGIAMGVAVLVPGRSVFWFVIFGFYGIAASFCPLTVLALFWPRYNAPGAVASMFTGFLSIPLFKFAVPHLPVVGPCFVRIEEMLPSFLLALAAGVVVTLLTSHKATDDNRPA
ncbi:sodium/proline symporter [Lignipirellula cremea]|uniref:Sodium/proline symporter n=1 Tax=Lignipirellula cremea TaxID=2528010 RepID=A0A518DX01_9BACT|nr:sodium/proline symporter [Lignipirellula cremea]QDU96366.1 Sodium/proline symporter [Lignipirellula cremea]